VEQKKNTALITSNDIKIVWRIVAKNWYIPLIIVFISYLIGYFYIYKLTNVYQASVELLKTNDTYYKDNLVSDQGFYGGNKSFVDNSNEIRIVKSYDLMKETVLKLKDKVEVSYYLVGRVRTTEQFVGMPFIVRINTVNSSLNEMVMNFKILNFDEYQITYNLRGVEYKKVGKFGQNLIDVDFNLIVDREKKFNRNLAGELTKLDYQIVIHDIDRLVHKFQRALEVENPDYTNVLVLKFDDILPDRAVLLLDTLSKLYLNKSLNARFELNERTISYIDKQLIEVSAALNDVEDTMQNYKRKNHILDLEWEKDDVFKKMARYEGEKTELNLKLDAIDDLEKYIIEDRDPNFLPPNVYLVDDDKFMSSSVVELYSMQLNLNEQLGFSKEINPHIIEIREGIKKLKQNMLVYLNNTRNATYKIIENIQGEIQKYIVQIKDIPPQQRDILNIQRKVSVNEALYNFLLQRKANIKIGKASIVPEMKVIDSPRNLGVIKPDKAKIQSVFLMVGGMISVLIIALRVLFFTTIQSVEELKEKTFLPIIGDLPFQKGVSNLGFVVEESPSSYIAEAFRALRTNLQYVILNSERKIILLTSNAPGEGKTFSTINLGSHFS
jgi:tyrosine-protein kinase Etk/Wzc